MGGNYFIIVIISAYEEECISAYVIPIKVQPSQLFFLARTTSSASTVFFFLAHIMSSTRTVSRRFLVEAYTLTHKTQTAH